MISLPVYFTIWEGQVNFWLAICVGEFIRLMLDDRPFIAGLWLGGWMLKPQLLPLITIFFLLHKFKKAFFGLTSSAFLSIVISFCLLGTRGVVNLLNILLL